VLASVLYVAVLMLLRELSIRELLSIRRERSAS
jgi:hypothetical protein